MISIKPKQQQEGRQENNALGKHIMRETATKLGKCNHMVSDKNCPNCREVDECLIRYMSGQKEDARARKEKRIK